RGLDLDAGQGAAALDHEVDLESVLVAEVVEAQVVVAPARLPTDLLDDEGLEHLPEQLAIVVQRWSIDPEQRTRDAGVAQVQLGRLDQPAQTVAVPRRELLEQGSARQQRHVVLDRRTTQVERRREL